MRSLLEAACASCWPGQWQQLHHVHNQLQQTLMLQLNLQKPAGLRPGVHVYLSSVHHILAWCQHVNSVLPNAV